MEERMRIAQTVPLNKFESVHKVLSEMNSHGLFDADIVTAQLGEMGWRVERIPSGYAIEHGATVGFLTPLSATEIGEYVGGTFFKSDESPPERMFIGWLFARQMVEILGVKPDELAWASLEEKHGEEYRLCYEAVESRIVKSA